MKLNRKNLKQWQFEFDERSGLWEYRTTKHLYAILLDGFGLWVAEFVPPTKEHPRGAWIQASNIVKAESLVLPGGDKVLELVGGRFV